jgi:hypothetical protein
MKECCKGNPRSANNKDKRGKEKNITDVSRMRPERENF